MVGKLMTSFPITIF